MEGLEYVVILIWFLVSVSAIFVKLCGQQPDGSPTRMPYTVCCNIARLYHHHYRLLALLLPQVTSITVYIYIDIRCRNCLQQNCQLCHNSISAACM